MQKGGALIGQGADTCVFSPPVSCRPGTEIPPEPLPPGEYVSRLISRDNTELEKQFAVGDAINRIDEMYPDINILRYTNFATMACAPLLKQEELADEDGEYCQPRNQPPLDNAARQSEFINLVTPKQDEDVQMPVIVDGVIQIDPVTGKHRYTISRPLEVTLAAMHPMMIAVAALNSEGVVHYDAHAGNISWMGDRTVLHDWGQAKSEAEYRVTFFERHAATPLSRTHMKKYPQFFIHMFIFDQLVDGNGNIQLSESQKELFLRMHDSLAIIGVMANLLRPTHPEFVNRARLCTRIAMTLLVYDFPPEVAVGGIRTLIDAFFEVPRSAETQETIDIYINAGRDEAAAAAGLLSLNEMQGGGMSTTSKFNRCVKSVKKTIRPRKGSTAESGAIAVCTKSILHPRGRTIKHYTRSRLQTQRRR